MKDYREKKYLEMLTEDEYIASEHIALRLDISGRTVRNELKELNKILETHGAKIISKPKFGYSIIVEERLLYNEYISNIKKVKHNNIPM